MASKRPRSYYELLDIAPDVKREAIALAYQRALEAMAREHDTDPDARAALRKAFEVLSDPVQRMTYDLTARPYQHAQSVQHSADEEDGSLVLRLWGHWWFKALVAGVILIGLVLWMKSGKSANGSAPLSSEQSIAAASGNSSASGSTPVVVTAASRSDAKPLPAPAGARSAEDVFGQVSVSVVRINVFNAGGAPVSTGSGVVIGPGSVITNCHVALGGETLEVKLGGAAYSATVEVADEERDLCRLGVNGLTAPAVSIGSVDSLRVGQRVFAIGAPQGLDLTISDGIVSALREVRGGKMIQTSAPVSPGSSGGGLFDASARLVGIVTFQNRVGQNLNFAVPADWVSEIRNR